MSPNPNPTKASEEQAVPDEETRRFDDYWRERCQGGQHLWDSDPSFKTYFRNLRKYGVNLDPDAVPPHVRNFRCCLTPIPHIVAVTYGGLKIDEPMGAMANSALEEKLRLKLRAFRKVRNPYTGADDTVPLPLPDDLTLPPEQLDGIPRTGEYQYPGGYLKRDADKR